MSMSCSTESSVSRSSARLGLPSRTWTFVEILLGVQAPGAWSCSQFYDGFLYAVMVFEMQTIVIENPVVCGTIDGGRVPGTVIHRRMLHVINGCDTNVSQVNGSRVNTPQGGHEVCQP